jgi:uncharacterized DUF497 family protein
VITWDETKRQANIQKHGLDFVGAEAIFGYATVGYEDDSEAYGEQRLCLIGFLAGQIVHLTYTAETFITTDEHGAEGGRRSAPVHLTAQG